jgi:hypothetical protein
VRDPKARRFRRAFFSLIAQVTGQLPEFLPPFQAGRPKIDPEFTNSTAFEDSTEFQESPECSRMHPLPATSR